MISVLIITRERPQLLKKCLASLADWEGKVPLQIIVLINGPDQVTEDFLAQHQQVGLEWQLLPVALTPGAARNVGLEKVKGEWTFFLDDDARVPTGYLEYWLKTSRSLADAQVVGGSDAPPPESEGLARAVAIALSSPLCTGATFHRHRAKGFAAKMVDETSLTSCNLWVRSHWWYKGVRFPEDYRRGEETVLLQDLKSRTPQLWWVPGLEVWHTRRSNWRALARASKGGGFYRARGLREHGGPHWFWLAPIFVILHLTAIAMPPVFFVLAAMWLLATTAVSTWLCAEAKRWQAIPIVVFLHWWILFTYGVGFIQYLIEWMQEP